MRESNPRDRAVRLEMRARMDDVCRELQRHVGLHEEESLIRRVMVFAMSALIGGCVADVTASGSGIDQDGIRYEAHELVGATAVIDGQVVPIERLSADTTVLLQVPRWSAQLGGAAADAPEDARLLSLKCAQTRYFFDETVTIPATLCTDVPTHMYGGYRSTTSAQVCVETTVTVSTTITCQQPCNGCAACFVCQDGYGYLRTQPRRAADAVTWLPCNSHNTCEDDSLRLGVR